MELGKKYTNLNRNIIEIYFHTQSIYYRIYFLKIKIDFVKFVIKSTKFTLGYPLSCKNINTGFFQIPCERKYRFWSVVYINNLKISHSHYPTKIPVDFSSHYITNNPLHEIQFVFLGHYNNNYFLTIYLGTHVLKLVLYQTCSY